MIIDFILDMGDKIKEIVENIIEKIKEFFEEVEQNIRGGGVKQLKEYKYLTKGAPIAFTGNKRYALKHIYKQLEDEK